MAIQGRSKSVISEAAEGNEPLHITM